MWDNSIRIHAIDDVIIDGVIVDDCLLPIDCCFLTIADWLPMMDYCWSILLADDYQ